VAVIWKTKKGPEVDKMDLREVVLWRELRWVIINTRSKLFFFLAF
jgi:hypothetical protein